jgi:23S rRNA (pseudouridine1915-N3)-methyltransferase
MKIVFIYLESSKEEWVQKALEVYTKKIQRFGDFEIIKIKAPALKRDSKDAKLKSESKLILDRIHSNDYVILFDERGKEFNSLEYSAKLQKIINQSPKRIVFIIGGAFGVSQEVSF